MPRSSLPRRITRPETLISLHVLGLILYSLPAGVMAAGTCAEGSDEGSCKSDELVVELDPYGLEDFVAKNEVVLVSFCDGSGKCRLLSSEFAKAAALASGMSPTFSCSIVFSRQLLAPPRITNGQHSHAGFRSGRGSFCSGRWRQASLCWAHLRDPRLPYHPNFR